MYSIINHTKIIIYDQDTRKSTTLLDTAKSTTGQVVAGIPFIDVVDDSLDSFVFIIKNYATRKAFKPFDLVEFTVGDETTQMFVLFDNVKTYSRVDNTYMHTVSCVETTKYLEKIKVFNLVMTNKSDTLLRQFEKALANAEPIITPSAMETTRFTLSDSLTKFLDGKASRDFYFSNTDLRSILDEMLNVHNARCAVEKVSFDEKYGVYTFSIGFFTLDIVNNLGNVDDKFTLEEYGEIIYEEAENDGQNYAGTIVARGNNSIPYTPITFRDITKSRESTMSDSSACFILPFPISYKGIEKLTAEVESYYDVLDMPGNIIYEPVKKLFSVDLSEVFIPQEQYDLLSKDDAKNKIPYQIGSNVIDLGKAYKNWLGWQESTVGEIIKKRLRKEYPNTIIANDTPALKYVSFSITYYPIYDTVATLTKEESLRKKNSGLMGIMDSQAEKTLDIERHGKKLAGLIKRTGNAEYYVDVKAKYYSKLLPLMSKIDLPNADSADGNEEKGYVLYKREYSIYDNFINCRYYFSKDYNAVQKNAGVNREKHLYDIPLESSETPIVIKKYLKLGGIYKDETTFDERIPFAALNTLIGESQFHIQQKHTAKENGKDVTVLEGYDLESMRLKYMLFKSYAGSETYPQDTDIADSEDFPYKYNDNAKFIVPLGAYALEKTMFFAAKPLDNYSVNYSRAGYTFSVWGDGGYSVSYNRYVSNGVNIVEGEKVNVNIVGEAEVFTLQYAFDYKYKPNWILYYDDEAKQGNYMWIYQKAVLPDSLPIVDTTKTPLYMASYESYDGTVSEAITVNYNKDRSQTPLFVLALECIVDKGLQGKLFIGTAFAKNNNLICDNPGGLKGLFLFTSTTKEIVAGADTIPLSEFSIYGNGEQEAGEFFSVKKSISSPSATINLKKGISIENITAWAIADEQGNIYLAGNGAISDVTLGIVNSPN